MKLTQSLIGRAALVVASLAISGSNAVASSITYNGPVVTFEQVFENPDDNEQKLNYARQQAAAGDLLSAAGALEGMLFSQPNWDSARVLYAVVLFELDDRASALREFELLSRRPLSGADQKLVTSYSQAISNPAPPKSAVTGVVEFGLRADNNAGNALLDTVLDLPNESDGAAFINGVMKLSLPLTKSGGLNFNARARGQTRKQFSSSNSDYDVLGADLGVSGEGEALFWSADFSFDNVSFGGEKYLTQMGPKLSVGTKLSEKTRLTLAAAIYDQDFESLSFSFGEKFRSGNKSVLSAKVHTRVDENLTYGVSLGYEDKNATQDALAYKGFHVAGNVFKGFDSGMYLKANARYRDLNFDAANLLSGTATDRDDSQILGRVGAGASLNKISGWLGMEPNPAFTKVYMETGVNYTNYDSSVSFFEYENLGADVKFIVNF